MKAPKLNTLARRMRGDNVPYHSPLGHGTPLTSYTELLQRIAPEDTEITVSWTERTLFLAPANDYPLFAERYSLIVEWIFKARENFKDDLALMWELKSLQDLLSKANREAIFRGSSLGQYADIIGANNEVKNVH